MSLTYHLKVKDAQGILPAFAKDITRLRDVAQADVNNAKTRTVKAAAQGKLGILNHILFMMENTKVEIEGKSVTFDEAYKLQHPNT